MPRAVAEAAGDPRPASVRQSVGLLGRHAAPLGGAAAPARASAPGPAEASAACVPSAAHPWPRATLLAGPRLGSRVLPAAAARRLLRDAGARPCLPRPRAAPGARLEVRRLLPDT